MANNSKELKKIRYELIERSKEEANRLWRLARKAMTHGCSQETVDRIREEADWCYGTGTAYPERLLSNNPGMRFQYAFQY